MGSTDNKPGPLVPPHKPLRVTVQGMIVDLEGHLGAILLKAASVLIGFFLLAVWFNIQRNHGFSNQEAMEAAQLGRRLATGQGYTTECVRPAVIGMLQRANPDNATNVLKQPTPDLSIAPGYPVILAALMKALPFEWTADPARLWTFQPETVIDCFNELLLLASAVLLFRMAKRLFDSGVAWVSAVVFVGGEIYWRFCLSGLSTIWLTLIFLTLARCLMALEERERAEESPARKGPLILAALAGALVGIGGLTRYSFAWLLVPTLLFFGVFFKRRFQLCALALGACLVVMAPWIGRNLALSQTPFGTATYAYIENTRPLEGDRMERSFDPLAGSHRLQLVRGMINKFLINERKILQNELPRLGGNWAAAFFLCGLLLRFRTAPLRRLRVFAVGAIGVMALAQALGQTNLSLESPEINSENLLVVVAPLAVVFGAGFFFILLDQLELSRPIFRMIAATAFVLVVCAPLLLDLVSPMEYTGVSPYVPYQIQRTARLMEPDELMMSDVPWAVAWYGDRSCVLLTADCGDTFNEMCQLKPVKGLYLTERSTDKSLLTQALDQPKGWGRFLINAMPATQPQHGMLPTGFPLTRLLPGYVPIQLFLSDKVRWEEAPKK